MKAYGLNYHKPKKTDRNTMRTKFEQFFQNPFNDITDIPENGIEKIKTKLHNACGKQRKSSKLSKESC